jgi:hypothetical protein
VEREIGEQQGAIKVEMDIIRKRNGKREGKEGRGKKKKDQNKVGGRKRQIEIDR